MVRLFCAEGHMREEGAVDVSPARVSPRNLPFNFGALGFWVLFVSFVGVVCLFVCLFACLFVCLFV